MRKASALFGNITTFSDISDFRAKQILLQKQSDSNGEQHLGSNTMTAVAASKAEERHQGQAEQASSSHQPYFEMRSRLASYLLLRCSANSCKRSDISDKQNKQVRHGNSDTPGQWNDIRDKQNKQVRHPTCQLASNPRTSSKPSCEMQLKLLGDTPCPFMALDWNSKNIFKFAVEDTPAKGSILAVLYGFCHLVLLCDST